MGKNPQISHFGAKTDVLLKSLKEHCDKGGINDLWAAVRKPGLNAYQRMDIVDGMTRCKENFHLQEHAELFPQLKEARRPKDRPERSEFAFRPEFFPGNNAANAWAVSTDGKQLAYLTQTDVAMDWTDRPASELETLVGTRRERMAINFINSSPRENKTIFLTASESVKEDFKGPCRMLSVDSRWVILESQSTKGSKVWCIPLNGDQEPKLSRPLEITSPVLGYEGSDRNVAYEASPGCWCLKSLVDDAEMTFGPDPALSVAKIPPISKIVFDQPGKTGVLIPKSDYRGSILLGVLEVGSPTTRWIQREEVPGLDRVSDGCFLPEGLVRRSTLFVLDDQGRAHSLSNLGGSVKHLRWPETQAPLRDCATVIAIGTGSGWLSVLFSSRKIIRFYNYEHMAILMDLKVPCLIDSMAWAFQDRVLITRNRPRGPRQYLEATLIDFLTVCGKDTTKLVDADLAKIKALLKLVPHHPQLEAIQVLVDHWKKEASHGR